MTLKNIPLPAVVLANLFKHSLIGLQVNEKQLIHQCDDIIFFGGNNKHILLLVNNPDADFLPDDQLTFLTGILTACNLSMDDVAIVNLNKPDELNYKNIPDILKAEIIILSGIELSRLELPFKIPLFQVQLYKGQKYIPVPSLHAIQKDTVLKRKLWELLRIVFSV
ncbi:MAG: hypothetical protein ABIN97_19120 [Ginsengibacter sp.]